MLFLSMAQAAGGLSFWKTLPVSTDSSTLSTVAYCPLRDSVSENKSTVRVTVLAVWLGWNYDSGGEGE